MKSVNLNLVISHYLSVLPKNILACPLLNYNTKILTDFSIVKFFILADLCKWDGLYEIKIGIRAKREVQKEIGVKSISYSQLSHRFVNTHTGNLVDLLGHLAARYWKLQRNVKFLVRRNFRMITLKSIKLENPKVLKNELISMMTREEPLRYIHFKNDSEKDFHLFTNRLDLSEEEIMETYRNRWYIELFSNG